MATHTAAWIKTKHAALEVGLAETPTPGPGELLVKIKLIAFSPIEARLQKTEIVGQPLSYPNILGFSFAGVVEKVGPGVEGFSVGDNVAAHRPHYKGNDPRFGSFQQYTLAAVATTSKLPSENLLEAGASAILNLATVASALSFFQGLDKPSLDKSAPAPSTGKKILIYGGSSSCGGLGITYAKAAGYTVVTTSSPRNRDYVSSLGPDVVIDHRQSPDQVAKEIEANGPYYRIWDTIGIPPVTNILAGYLGANGGGSYHTVIPVLPAANPIPENVKVEFQPYSAIFYNPANEEFRKWFYGTLLPQGLASGVIVPTPSQWVKGGLPSTQQALDLLSSFQVSGHKLILDPWE
ncbi:chaperonin 10-like protein [Cladorrhinum samala]|jgi:NADPH:quinone reductase-like Zn-dependent oxidoreductase|uniref:Chaperonin 10-like protein n=1 Tax=Cladorrhinum samala TaxID=585594 RepID=A0AAV9HPL3_9PEZI|nr:chaperonin 10-like protein [Cladorrhinum samala]